VSCRIYTLVETNQLLPVASSATSIPARLNTFCPFAGMDPGLEMSLQGTYCVHHDPVAAEHHGFRAINSCSSSLMMAATDTKIFFFN
jgi:hypothetical protein